MAVLLAEPTQIVALVATNVDEEDAVFARRGGAQQALHWVHVKPHGPALSPTGHVRVEQGLVALVIGEPLELALTHCPLHGRAGVFLRVGIIVGPQILRESAQSRDGEVVSKDKAVSGVDPVPTGTSNLHAWYTVSADRLGQGGRLVIGTVHLGGGSRTQS